jgi:hypothetical protein
MVRALSSALINCQLDRYKGPISLSIYGRDYDLPARRKSHPAATFASCKPTCFLGAKVAVGLPLYVGFVDEMQIMTDKLQFPHADCPAEGIFKGRQTM